MKSLIKELKYSLYLTVHPFKGFWEIKHEGQGSLRAAIVLLLLFVFSSIANGFYNGYLFNTNGGVNFNALLHGGLIAYIYLLWCVSNWCLTTLFDGEGSFVDICKATSYALVPMTISQIILIPLSNFLVLDEKMFFSIILYGGIIWTALLLLTGTITTHQYTLGKTLVIIVCIILSMCMITYILLLFVNLIQQMLGFIVTISREISIRS